MHVMHKIQLAVRDAVLGLAGRLARAVPRHHSCAVASNSDRAATTNTAYLLRSVLRVMINLLKLHLGGSEELCDEIVRACKAIEHVHLPWSLVKRFPLPLLRRQCTRLERFEYLLGCVQHHVERI